MTTYYIKREWVIDAEDEREALEIALGDYDLSDHRAYQVEVLPNA